MASLNSEIGGQVPEINQPLSGAMPETPISLGAAAGGVLEGAVDAHAADAGTVLKDVDSVLDSASDTASNEAFIPPDRPLAAMRGADPDAVGAELRQNIINSGVGTEVPASPNSDLDPQSQSILNGPPATDADRARSAEEDARVAQDLGPEPVRPQPTEAPAPTRPDATPRTEQNPPPPAEEKTLLSQERAQILQNKDSNGNFSAEQIKRLQEIDQRVDALNQDPQMLKESGMKKIEEGKSNELTDAEKAALEGKETPEEEANGEEADKKLKAEMNELSDTIADKLFTGQDAVDDIIAFNQKLAESQGFKLSDQDEQIGREFIKGILTPDSSKDVKESARTKRVKKLLQDLCRKEIQLRNQATVVERMEKQAKEVLAEMNRAEDDYAKEDDPEQKQQKSLIYSSKTTQYARVLDRMKAQKSLGRELNLERKTSRLEVRKALGSRNFLSNAILSGSAAATGVGNAVADRYDSVFA